MFFFLNTAHVNTLFRKIEQDGLKEFNI